MTARLLCSGNYTHGGRCYSEARWAIAAEDDDMWHGACSHHLNQVVRRITGNTRRVLVEPVTVLLTRLAEPSTVEDLLEDLLEEARELVHNSMTTWDAARMGLALSNRLRDHRQPISNDEAQRVLDALVTESVMEKTAPGSYESISFTLD
jgi:hypothetical protein